MRQSTAGMIFGGTAATTGAILMWKADWLATDWHTFAGSRTTCGFVGLIVLGAGLFVATLAFQSWLGEDRIR